MSPPRRTGLLVGGALGASGFGLAFAALATLVRFYPAPWSVAFAGLALLCAGTGAIALYWTASLASLRYMLRGSVVYVQWGGAVIRLPLCAVQQVIPGSGAGPIDAPRGLFWPGCAIGRARIEGVGDAVLFATKREPAGLLLLVSPDFVVGITAGPSTWATTISPAVPSPRAAADDPRAVLAGLRRVALWDDHVLWWLVLAGLLIVLLNWGLALSRAPAVAEFARYLGTVRLDRPDDLVALAAIGAAILVMDIVVGALLYAWDAFAARLLILAGALGQGIIFIALLSLG